MDLYGPIIRLFSFYLGFLSPGLALVALTLTFQFFLLPLSLFTLKMREKQKVLAPKLRELGKKYKDDREKLAKKQMELMRSQGINPLVSFLPQVLFIVLTIVLYQALRQAVPQVGEGSFLWFKLLNPDPYYILPLILGGMQFLAFRSQGKGGTMGGMKFIFPLLTLVLMARLSSWILLFALVSFGVSLGTNFILQRLWSR